MPRGDRVRLSLDDVNELMRTSEGRDLLALPLVMAMVLIGGIALGIYNLVRSPESCQEFVLSFDSSCPVGSPLEVVDHLPICRCPP